MRHQQPSHSRAATATRPQQPPKAPHAHSASCRKLSTVLSSQTLCIFRIPRYTYILCTEVYLPGLGKTCRDALHYHNSAYCQPDLQDRHTRTHGLNFSSVIPRTRTRFPKSASRCHSINPRISTNPKFSTASDTGRWTPPRVRIFASCVSTPANFTILSDAISSTRTWMMTSNTRPFPTRGRPKMETLAYHNAFIALTLERNTPRFCQ